MDSKNESTKKLTSPYLQSSLRQKRGKTGIVYHRQMAEPYFLCDKEYLESPDRFSRILQR